MSSGAPLRSWTNATISFYAATVNAAGGVGSYGLTNVSLRRALGCIGRPS